jgi:putative peptidoglycan lipid II flippase
VATAVPLFDRPITPPVPELNGRGASLLRSTASVSIATLLARLAGAGKTALITFFFRPGGGLDAYLLSFLLVSFLADVFCGALTPVLVPALVEGEVRGRNNFLAIYAAALYRSVSGALLLATALGTMTLAVHRMGWFHEPGDPGLFNRMLLIMLPVLPLNAVSSVWRSVLNAELRFAAASFSYVLTPFTAALWLAFAHGRGVVVLAAGTACGVMAEALFLAAVLRRNGTPLFPGGAALAPGQSLPRKQYGAVVASNLLSKGSIAVDQAAAALSGVGGLSILTLGTRLTAVVLAVGPGALSIAILPRFSRLLAKGTPDQARNSLIRTLGFWLTAMALLSCVLIWLSSPVVRLAFSHGALTGADLYRVTQAQRWSLVQAPFTVGLAILFPFVSSLKANHSVVPVWLAALAAHALFDYLVLKRYGVAGIICVSAAIEALVVVATLIIVFRKLRARDLNQGSVA